MASETVLLTDVCAGGNHLTFTLTGAKETTVHMELRELSTPVTEHDLESFCKVIAKLAKAGRTNAQARAVLESGVTVTA